MQEVEIRILPEADDFSNMVKICGMLSLTVKVLPVLHGMCFLKNATTVY